VLIKAGAVRLRNLKRGKNSEIMLCAQGEKRNFPLTKGGGEKPLLPPKYEGGRGKKAWAYNGIPRILAGKLKSKSSPTGLEGKGRVSYKAGT